MLISFEQFYRVASSDFAFSKNGKIEPRPAALQESLYDVWATEANAELKTWHSRLSDDKLCRADPKAVTNVNRFLKQAFRCEVLAENSPR
jgi:hypothetical protein